MFFVKALRSPFYSLKPYANFKPKTLVALSPFTFNSSTNQRYVSTSALHEQQAETHDTGGEAYGSGGTNAKPYDIMFKEAVGFIETTGELEREIEDQGGSVGVGGEVGKKLQELEVELTKLTGNENSGKLEWRSRKWWRQKEMETKRSKDGDNRVSKKGKGIKVASGDSAELDEKSGSKDKGGKGVDGDDGNGKSRTSLSALFGRKGAVRKDSILEEEKQVLRKGTTVKWIKQQKGIVAEQDRILREREDLIVKELSPDMQVFARHLYEEGYFKEANFLPQNRFDVSCFESSFALAYLKYAADRYGRDKQEIAKWLSGSDLKQIALFGCPSLAKKTVFSAKSLRTFFQIPEDTVCRKCVLRESCKFVNQSVWTKNTKQLKLQPIMRVLTTYALEAVPTQLAVSDDINDCVSRLMKNIMNLSKTVP